MPKEYSDIIDSFRKAFVAFEFFFVLVMALSNNIAVFGLKDVLLWTFITARILKICFGILLLWYVYKMGSMLRQERLMKVWPVILVLLQILLISTMASIIIPVVLWVRSEKLASRQREESSRRGTSYDEEIHISAGVALLGWWLIFSLVGTLSFSSPSNKWLLVSAPMVRLLIAIFLVSNAVTGYYLLRLKEQARKVMLILAFLGVIANFYFLQPDYKSNIQKKLVLLHEDIITNYTNALALFNEPRVVNERVMRIRILTTKQLQKMLPSALGISFVFSFARFMLIWALLTHPRVREQFSGRKVRTVLE